MAAEMAAKNFDIKYQLGEDGAKRAGGAKRDVIILLNQHTSGFPQRVG